MKIIRFLFLLLFVLPTIIVSLVGRVAPVFAEEVPPLPNLLPSQESNPPQEVKDYNTLLSEGVIKLNSQGDLSEAILLFEQAIAQDTQGVEAYYYIGVAQARMNLVAEAESSFKKALALDPLFIPAHFDLGVLYYSQGTLPAQEAAPMTGVAPFVGGVASPPRPAGAGHSLPPVGADEAALISFDIVQKADPDRARVYFYQGLLLRRLGKFKEAAAKLEEAAQRDPVLAPEAYHQAGEAYYKANDLNASKRVLQKAIALTPGSAAAKEAQDFLKNIDIPEITQRKESPWSLSLLTGILYDDNVILGPEGTASQTDDMVGFLRVRGGYKLTANKSAAYSFYENDHADVLFRDYDVQDHNLSFNVRPFRFQDRLNVDYQLQVALLGNEHYLTYYTLGTQYLLSKSNANVTELSYQFQVKRYYNIVPLFPTSEDRDALGHQVGIRHAVIVAADINLRGGYFFEADRTGSSALEDDWSFTGHRFKSGITLPAWRKLTTAIDLEYLFRPYDNENTFASGVKRRDQGNLLNMTLSRPWGEHVQVVFSTLYQRNYSNISTFDYGRSVYGLLAIARF